MIDVGVELNTKLRLERKLLGELKLFNRSLVRAVARDLAVGRPPNALVMRPEVEAMLTRQYDRVGPIFGKSIADQLPDEDKPTDIERQRIAQALTAYYAQRGQEQAGIISDTNQREVEESVVMAQELPESNSRVEFGLLAGVILARKLATRAPTIAMFETQASAEAAKLTEAQVLTFQPPSVIGGTPSQAEVKKTWGTVGDERVRPEHRAADNQDQDLNAPFIVGGQQMRYPGDTSLGASLKNVINCRCSSIVDEQDVLAIRRQRGQQPQTDRTVSEQLATSMGL